MIRALLLVAALFALPLTAAAQTVTVTAPNAVNPAGQPTAIGKTFIVNADGSIGSGAVSRGAPSIATTQVSVGTTATLLAAQRTGRHNISVIIGAANACAIGPAGVTLSTGYALAPVAGATDTSNTSAALYGVCSVATTVSVKELF